MLLRLAAVSKKEAAKSGGAWKPEKDIHVIVAYKAGSGTDTGARILCKDAEKHIGKTLIVDNKPGADGKIGWTELSKAKPDGYTIGYINLPTYTTLALQKGSAFNEKSIVPIANHLKETSVVVVRADSKWKTLKDLVADAQQNPGKLKASTNGVQASNHTAAQLLALRQGEVDFSCAKVGDVEPLIGGASPVLRVLGVYSEKRLDNLKDVPTLGELGYYNKWYGTARALVAPKGTPDNIINYYVNIFKIVMTDEQTIRDHKNAGLTMDYLDNKQLGELISQQLEFCRDVVSKLYTK